MAAAGGGEGGGARILLEVAANSAHFALSVRCIHGERGGEGGWRGDFKEKKNYQETPISKLHLNWKLVIRRFLTCSEVDNDNNLINKFP